MKKIINLSLTLLCVSILLMVPSSVHARESTLLKENPTNNSLCNLKMQERKLWIDHVLWTRNFIISDLASLEDKDIVLERLLKNQDDIGDSIKPFYGEDAGNKLSALLREHIVIAGQVVDAAKANNKTDLEKYNKLWYENADQIADFLSSANPNYSNKVLKDMLHTHLELTTNEAVTRIKKDWKSDIAEYDKGEDHMIHFSDILIDGISKQFPEKFNS